MQAPVVSGSVLDALPDDDLDVDVDQLVALQRAQQQSLLSRAHEQPQAQQGHTPQGLRHPQLPPSMSLHNSLSTKAIPCALDGVSSAAAGGQHCSHGLGYIKCPQREVHRAETTACLLAVSNQLIDGAVDEAARRILLAERQRLQALCSFIP